MRTRSLPTWVGVVCLLAMASCQSPLAHPTGSLRVTLGDEVSRTLSPTISMVPVSYELYGVGPSGSTFEVTVTDGATTTLSALAFGSWTVSATAKNASGVAIGVGSGTVVVHSNTMANLAITVTPYAGFGTLSLSLDWPAAQVDVAQIVASLLPSVGMVRPLSFTVDAPSGSASFSATDVPTGYHTLSLQLKDNGALTMGAVEVVRIVEGQTTTGAYHFINLNQATGGIQVNLSPEMADPLTVTIGGGAATKSANQSLALSATVAETDVNATFVWYVNGEAVGTGALWTMDDSWALGHYRVDVTAFSADGKRAGSQTHALTVVDGLPEVVINEVALAAGNNHSLVVDGNNTLWAFGLNNAGQLGDGTKIDRHSPVVVYSADPRNPIVSLSAGGFHSAYVLADGSLWTFGSNDYGQLGNGTATGSDIPVQVMSDVKEVKLGYYHSLAVKTDGTLWAFGRNSFGQLGDGTYIDRHSPVQVAEGVMGISTRASTSLVLKDDGSLWSTGNGFFGALGDGTTTHRNFLQQVLSNVASVSTGTGFSLAVKEDGSVWGFGSNSSGELGDGTFLDRLSPVATFPGTSQVTTGSSSSYYLMADGQLLCLGSNSFGQLGNGTTQGSLSPTKALVGKPEALAAGGSHTLVIDRFGNLWTFGRNVFGQLGLGTTADSPVPAMIPNWNYRGIEAPQ